MSSSPPDRERRRTTTFASFDMETIFDGNQASSNIHAEPPSPKPTNNNLNLDASPSDNDNDGVAEAIYKFIQF